MVNNLALSEFYFIIEEIAGVTNKVMNDQLDVSENLFGKKVFTFQVQHYALDIKTITNTILYCINLYLQSPHNSYSLANEFWDFLDRGMVLKSLSIWLLENGTTMDSDEAYPRARYLHGETAKKFAEDLFPELIYDQEVYQQNWDAFTQKLREKSR